MLAACRDPLSTEDFAGEYALITVGGMQLPRRTVTAGDTHYVWSERLVVERSARARTERVGETRRQNGSVGRYTIVSDYATRVEHNYLAMTFLCPVNALCASPSTLFLYRESDGGVRLEQRGWIGPSRYIRASPP